MLGACPRGAQLRRESFVRRGVEGHRQHHPETEMVSMQGEVGVDLGAEPEQPPRSGATDLRDDIGEGHVESPGPQSIGRGDGRGARAVAVLAEVGPRQTTHAIEPQRVRGEPQLMRTTAPEIAAAPAARTIGRHHQLHPLPGRNQAGQGSSRVDGLIVGVGHHRQDVTTGVLARRRRGC